MYKSSETVEWVSAICNVHPHGIATHIITLEHLRENLESRGYEADVPRVELLEVAVCAACVLGVGLDRRPSLR